MPNYNRSCLNCGEKYYVCMTCININSWKTICCSTECYMSIINKNIKLYPNIINESGDGLMRYIMRAGLLNGETIDISGYDFELGKYDCSDGKTRILSDFEYLIIPVAEVSEIHGKVYPKITSEKVSENKTK